MRGADFGPGFVETQHGAMIEPRHHLHQRVEVVQLEKFLGSGQSQLTYSPLNITPLKKGTAAILFLCLSHENASTPLAPFKFVEVLHATRVSGAYA